MNKFMRYSCGSMRGDCTSAYELVFLKEYTVFEFIQEMLTQYDDEHGYIMLETDTENGQRNLIKICDYSRGKLITKTSLFDELSDRIIESAKADGGWSAMDYFIKLKE